MSNQFIDSLVNPEPRGPRVLPVGELVTWYGMFAPCGRLLGTMAFAHGAPLLFIRSPFHIGIGAVIVDRFEVF